MVLELASGYGIFAEVCNKRQNKKFVIEGVEIGDFRLKNYGVIVNNYILLPFLYAERNGRAYFSFFLGCLLYELFAAKLIEKYIKYTSVILITSLVIWWFNKGNIISLLNTEQFGKFDFVMTVLVIPLVISIALCDNRASRVLNMRVFQALGHISSTLYMTHWVMITFLFISIEQFPVLVNIPCMCIIFISLVCAVFLRICGLKERIIVEI